MKKNLFLYMSLILLMPLAGTVIAQQVASLKITPVVWLQCDCDLYRPFISGGGV